MKKCIFFATLFTFTSFVDAFCQPELLADFNLMIFVNDEIDTHYNLDNFVIYYGGKKTEQLGYIPGRLRIGSYYAELLENEEIELFFREQRYTEDGKSNVQEYRIKMNHRYLLNSYVIVQVYNSSYPDYDQKFISLPGVNYTFEIMTTGFRMQRVRKK